MSQFEKLFLAPMRVVLMASAMAIVISPVFADELYLRFDGKSYGYANAKGDFVVTTLLNHMPHRDLEYFVTTTVLLVVAVLAFSSLPAAILIPALRIRDVDDGLID